MYYYRPKQHKGVAAFVPKPPVKPPRNDKHVKRRPVKEPPETHTGHSGFFGLLRTILAVALILVVLAGTLYILPPGVFGSYSREEYGVTYSLPEGYTNILFIGADVDSNGTSRSDTMMIVSVSRNKIYLTSLQRDTGVYMEGHSGLIRLNAAYQYGGPEGLLRVINQNFGFDITRYVLVDYDSCPRIIDIIGGIDIEGITDSEAVQINRNMYEIIDKRYKAGRLSYDAAWELYNGEYVAGGGDLHLDGLQALGYARIRKLDSDYGRTNRQRKIIKAGLTSLKSAVKNPFTLLRLMFDGPGIVKTNMGTLELISIGEKAVLSSVAGQTRLPADGTYTDNGGMFYNVDYAANHRAFIQFVYN